jgi:hypothetical protein
MLPMLLRILPPMPQARAAASKSAAANTADAPSGVPRRQCWHALLLRWGHDLMLASNVVACRRTHQPAHPLLPHAIPAVDLRLPGLQSDLVKALSKFTDAPMAVVLIHGGPLVRTTVCRVVWCVVEQKATLCLTAGPALLFGKGPHEPPSWGGRAVTTARRLGLMPCKPFLQHKHCLC